MKTLVDGQNLDLKLYTLLREADEVKIYRDSLSFSVVFNQCDHWPNIVDSLRRCFGGRLLFTYSVSSDFQLTVNISLTHLVDLVLNRSGYVYHRALLPVDRTSRITTYVCFTFSHCYTYEKDIQEG